MGCVWLSTFPCPYSHPDLMRSGTTYLNSSAGPGLPTETRTMQTPKKAVKVASADSASDPMASAAIPGDN